MSEENNNNKSLTPHVVKEFLDNQKRELEIRAAELELKARVNNNNFEYAMKGLDVEERVLKQQCAHDQKVAKYRYWFIGALVLISVGFLGFLALLGKDAMAMEIFKAAAFLATGAIGGFFYGKSQRGDNPAADSQPPSDE